MGRGRPARDRKADLRAGADLLRAQPGARVRDIARHLRCSTDYACALVRVLRKAMGLPRPAPVMPPHHGGAVSASLLRFYRDNPGALDNLRAHALRRGLGGKVLTLDDHARAGIVALYASGLGVKATAARAGYCHQIVLRVLTEAGVPRHPSGVEGMRRSPARKVAGGGTTPHRPGTRNVNSTLHAPNMEDRAR